MCLVGRWFFLSLSRLFIVIFRCERWFILRAVAVDFLFRFVMAHHADCMMSACGCHYLAGPDLAVPDCVLLMPAISSVCVFFDSPPVSRTFAPYKMLMIN